MGITKIVKGHGLSGSGLAHPTMPGVVGPGGSFVGRKTSQDTSRIVTGKQIGSNSGPRGSNDGNPGVKSGRTGASGRKSAGKVGFQKATGTK